MTMDNLLNFAPLVLMICAYTVFIKLAARVVRRTQLTWKHALVFGILVFLLGALVTFANSFTGQLLPLAAGIALSFLLQLALGGWYLGPRARTVDGQPVGFGMGALLSLLGYAFTFSLALVGAVGLPFVIRMAGFM